MEKKWIIYCHINKTNGKKYVGQTCQKVEDRWRKGKKYKGSPYFYSAIQKYGWDGFEHEILAECNTLKEANKLEKFYISILRSNEREYGYNITEGGEGSQGYSTPEEVKEKISKALKGKHCSPNTEFKTGNHPFTEFKAKRVRCVENGMVFDSIADAGRWVGKPTAKCNIVQCCKGKTKTAYGYSWEYV